MTDIIPRVVRDTSNEILYTVRLEATAKRFVLWLVRGDFKAQIGHIPFGAFELKFLNKRSEALFDKEDIRRIRKACRLFKGHQRLRVDLEDTTNAPVNVGTLSLELTVTRIEPSAEEHLKYNTVRVSFDEKTPVATWSHTEGVTFHKTAPSLFLKDRAWIAYECMNCMSEHGKGIFQ